MVKSYKYIILGLLIIAIVSLIMAFQNQHKAKNLQLKIDDSLTSSISELDHKLSKVDINTFPSSINVIIQAASHMRALAPLSSFENSQAGISSVANLLESALLNIDNSTYKMTEDQLNKLKIQIKELSKDPGNVDITNQLINTIGTIN
ncbi:hypothetical protein J2Z69_000475 [Paenibacillus shirakamiensis]|uniref:Uncharacterized protein n=1 Tax=Paenibacillus shirakamiensis TaxID=1265935 RepID=A0ABS4JEA8_9BACL|nr:hypothetical protein [Paenibacillus shirakamiensis]MBP1999456.1 hypothetical protein [Paenibacillus shirakamiensis]